jgi:hypothetical protein
MAALGEIEPIDAALHSDTTWERGSTYEFAAAHTPWLEAHGVRVVTVRPDDASPIDRHGGVMLQAFVLDWDGAGQIRRQCTGAWKISPMCRWLQSHRNGSVVHLLRGISLDEWHRAKDADVKYIVHEHPLIDRRMSRGDCILWLRRHGLSVPERSACVCCPFQSKRDWQGLVSADLTRAIDVDETIRHGVKFSPLYLHASLQPLSDVDLRSEIERGQTELWSLCATGECMT